MRLRVQTVPPLRESKVWFAPESFDKTPRTIIELKELMCWGLQVLKDAKASEEDIVLLLDDFELVDDSSVSALVRDGDLLTVAMKCEPEGLAVEIVDNGMEGPLTEEEVEEQVEEGDDGENARYDISMEQVEEQIKIERQESYASSGEDTISQKKRKRNVDADGRKVKRKKSKKPKTRTKLPKGIYSSENGESDEQQYNVVLGL